MPDVRWNQEHDRVTIGWKDQIDDFSFGTGEGGRTLYSMERDGKKAATLQGRPEVPAIMGQDRVFTDIHSIRFDDPKPAQEIRYTLDGNDPTSLLRSIPALLLLLIIRR